MEILAVVKIFGGAKKVVLNILDGQQVDCFDFDTETDKLLQPGQEGYRQIVNFFGEQFLRKNGQINFRKLWKFVYQDHHKLRIFNYLMEPLLFNELQKIKDFSKKSALIIFLPGLVDLQAYKNFNNILWLDWPRDQQFKEMADLDLPVDIEKLWEAQSRLFLRPDITMKISKSRQSLPEDIESWQKFLYKLSKGI